MAERALMFVHRGMDVKNQWGRAIAALGHMSNLEIALVWRRLSESVPVDDFKLHSEYKCLFKRAVREAERQNVMKNDFYGPESIRFNPTCDGFDDTYAFTGLAPSIHNEYDRISIGESVRYSRGNSGFSESSLYRERERDKNYEKFLQAVVKYGMHVSLGERVIKPLSDEPIDAEQVKEYCEALISVISDHGMDENTRQKIIGKINAARATE